MSVSGDFGPAPPGVNLAENQNGQIFGAVITLMVIGTVAVIMRFVARSTPNSISLASDDYLIVVALVGYIFIHKYKINTNNSTAFRIWNWHMFFIK
jgi:hypothetical protein